MNQLELLPPRQLVEGIHLQNRRGKVRFPHKIWPGTPGEGDSEWSEGDYCQVSKCGNRAEFAIGRPDHYTGYNTLKPQVRCNTVLNLSHLNALWCDLDHYGSDVPEELHGLHCAELWQLIAQDHPEVPKPTYIANSGRGTYLLWVLKNPIIRTENEEKWCDGMSRWRRLAEDIHEIMKRYGSDPMATVNLTGVLRLPQTINSKNDSAVEYYEYGQKIAFTTLRKAIKKAGNHAEKLETASTNYKARLEKRRAKNEERFGHLKSRSELPPVVRFLEAIPGEPPEQNPDPFFIEPDQLAAILERDKEREHQRQILSELKLVEPYEHPIETCEHTQKRKKRKGKKCRWSWFSLNNQRMIDLQRLARMRGGRFKDGRWNALYLFAVSIGLNTENRIAIEQEIESFIESNIDNTAQGRSYSAGNFDALILRFETWKTRNDNDTRPMSWSNAHAIKVLNITREEQRKLLTIIGPEEYRERERRRSMQNRRDAGAMPRSKYLGACSDQKMKTLAAVRDLFDQGLKTTQIAEQLGLSRMHVHRTLKKISAAEMIDEIQDALKQQKGCG